MNINDVKKAIKIVIDEAEKSDKKILKNAFNQLLLKLHETKSKDNDLFGGIDID